MGHWILVRQFACSEEKGHYPPAQEGFEKSGPDRWMRYTLWSSCNECVKLEAEEDFFKVDGGPSDWSDRKLKARSAMERATQFYKSLGRYGGWNTSFFEARGVEMSQDEVDAWKAKYDKPQRDDRSRIP